LAPQPPPPEMVAPDGLPGGHRGMFLMRHGPDGPSVFHGPEGQVEIWCPEELLMDSSLSPKLNGEQPEVATAKQAAEVAQKVKARWTTYLTFRKSLMGIQPLAKPNGRPDLDLPRHNPNDRFVNLTPDQRVRMARERRSFNEK